MPLAHSAFAMLGALLAMSTVVTLGSGARVGNFVYVWALVLAGWLAGRGARLATERSALLGERRAMQERSRIARELHDVVSHNVTAIVSRPPPNDAACPREHLRPHPGRDRDPRSPDADRAAPTARSPACRRLRRRRAPGPTAWVGGRAAARRLERRRRDLVTEGPPVAVGQGMELAIYRVVQEGLTNVRKHAAEPVAEVAIRWCSGDHVEVEVVNGGGHRNGASLPGTGYGLLAMTERVSAYGGRVSAGPTIDGFRLHVTMPLGAGA